MQDLERLCIRTGAKPYLVTVRYRTPPLDVVAPNKDARITLYPTGGSVLRFDAD
jgi:hypothetical protein